MKKGEREEAYKIVGGGGGVELGMQGTGGLRVGPPCPHPHLIRCQILNMSYVMGAKKDGTKAVIISFTLRLL